MYTHKEYVFRLVVTRIFVEIQLFHVIQVERIKIFLILSEILFLSKHDHTVSVVDEPVLVTG